MTPDERERLLTLLPRVSVALQNLLDILTHGEVPTDLRETTIADLRALMAALNPECLGPEPAGGHCQVRGVVWDHVRGGKLCFKHLPADVTRLISNAVVGGTQHGQITVEGRAYSWSAD